jgi:hypothetical protein
MMYYSHPGLSSPPFCYPCTPPPSYLPLLALPPLIVLAPHCTAPPPRAVVLPVQEVVIDALAPASGLNVPEVKRQLDMLREVVQGGLGLGSGGKASRGQQVRHVWEWGRELCGVQPLACDMQPLLCCVCD